MTAPIDENVYRTCAEFEEKMAYIYFQMASRFRLEDPELSALWVDMGIEEKQHAALLKFCRFAGKGSTEPTHAQINSIERLLENLSARAADSNLSPREAFEIALELETSEVNGIYRDLINPLRSSMQFLRRKIISATTGHLERLLSEARRHGMPEASLRRLQDPVDSDRAGQIDSTGGPPFEINDKLS